MTVKEPSAAEVYLTLGLAPILGEYLRGYVYSLDLEGGERMLDFGSGSGLEAGYLSRRLSPNGGSVTCVDVSKAWLHAAKRRLRYCPNVDFKLGELCELGLDERSYDAAFVHFVLHDIAPDELEHAVAKISRLLKEGGRLYVREPMAEGHGVQPDFVRALTSRHGLREVRSTVTESRFIGRLYTAVFENSVNR